MGPGTQTASTSSGRQSGSTVPTSRWGSWKGTASVEVPGDLVSALGPAPGQGLVVVAPTAPRSMYGPALLHALNGSSGGFCFASRVTKGEPRGLSSLVFPRGQAPRLANRVAPHPEQP